MALERELDGMLVVSLEQAVAAPYCGLLLADAGARVIKVERAEGDFARGYDTHAGGDSAIFAWLNRGKEAICLNLKDADDLAVMHEMLAKADVFVSNLAAGAVARMGLDGASLRPINPKLITCTITGYGQDGPMADRKAYDFLIQGETGLCSVTGTPEDPVRVGVSITDLSSGLTAFSAILRALIQRGRTGVGIDLTVSMFDVIADWMNMPLIPQLHGDGAPKRSGMQHSFVSPYGAYRCGDGAYVLLSVQSDREWAVLCSAFLGAAELAEDPRFITNADRYRNRAQVDELVEQACAKASADVIRTQLQSCSIACGRLNDVADLAAHPLLRRTVARTGGSEVDFAALPVRSKTPVAPDVPSIDQHGHDLRKEFAP